MLQNNAPKKTLRIAFGSPWRTIHPGLQHTLVGDLVLSNQFEALVGTNEFGISIPLAAKSWNISEDYKTFTFHIDTSQRFSNGEHLSAKDFKRSWEEALALEPRSNNSSLLDVMYKIRGFKDFEHTKSLSGIVAPDDATLSIEFETPFRMALDHFQGNRFAAFKNEGRAFLGTGKYVIAEEENQNLRLRPNPYGESGLAPIELSVVPSDQAVGKLLDGSLDVFAYGRGSAVPRDLKTKSNLSILAGQDALHEAIILNLLPGRFFENAQFRLAMQYLMHKELEANPNDLGNPDYSSVDAQVFLPFQTGRIKGEETESIINSGYAYVPALVAATQKHPILVFLSEGDGWLIPFLKRNGISVAPASRVITPKERIDVFYKTFEPDIIMSPFGVANGDPDGIYHCLGKAGAIMTPMSYSERVAGLLEEGRKIIDPKKLDSFYQNVTRAVLLDVPFVHLGYSKAVAIYRNDLVALDSKELRRNEGHLNGFTSR
jgi:ABC-type transport system substrate-binding protein